MASRSERPTSRVVRRMTLRWTRGSEKRNEFEE